MSLRRCWGVADMVAIYVRWIKSGKLTIDQVPERWRADVEAALAAECEG